MRALFLFLVAGFWFLASAPAHAACSSPAGVAGKIIYNADQKVVQYCDNTNWIPAGFPGSGAGGCTSPARSEGTIIYNADNAVMQFCGGSVWVPMAQPGTASTTGSLVGHWKLDEASGTSAADSSGTNTGTLTNFPASPWTTGQMDGALTFDGTNDEVGGAATGLPAANASQTFSAWFKYSSVQSAGARLAGTYRPSSSSGVQFGFSCCTGSLVADQFGGGILLSSSTIPSAGVWHHLVYTWDGTTNALYLDGVLDSTSTTAHPQTAIPDTSQIGVAYGGTSYFGGQIDDVRVYNYALSADEIAQLTALGANTETNLLGHWKLDESSGTSAGDSAGTSTGTLTNMAGTEWTSGQVDGALTFDGTNDYVTMGDIAAMDSMSAITVATWVKHSEVAERHMVDKASCDGSNGSWELVSGAPTANGTPMFTIYGTPAAWDSSNQATTNVADGQWHHVTGTYDGTTANIYVDGVLENSNPISVAMNNSPQNVELGGNCNGAWTYQLNGQLDDVRVYSRALSPVDISALADAFPGDCVSPKGYKGELIYNSTKTMLQYCNGTSWVAVGKNAGSYASDMVGYWKFDEASGTSAADSSGNGYTGTLTNSLVWQPTAGKVAGALDFGGVGANGYVTAGDINAAEGITAVTVSAWVKTRNSGESHYVDKSNCDGTGAAWELFSGWPGGTGMANFGIGTGAAIVDAQSGESTTTISDGAWHLLTGVYDGFYIRIYVDGVEESSTAYANKTIYNNTNNVEIGGHCNGAVAHQALGLIDEVRIYNRALAPSEIQDLYNNTNGTPGAGTGIAFVTSTTYSGNLGGVAGADAICQARASAAGLSGTFKAWISTGAGNQPSTTFAQSPVGYVMTNGEIIANNWADLVNGLDTQLDISELGTDPGGTNNVWTNVLISGATEAAVNCLGWVDSTAGQSGARGLKNGTVGATWTDSTTNACNALLRLYCFQQ